MAVLLRMEESHIQLKEYLMSKDKEQEELDNLTETLPSKMDTPEAVADLESQLADDVQRKKMVI